MVIHNKYQSQREEFLQLLSELEDISDEHLGRITTAKHQIELKSEDTRPLYRALYSANPTARPFAAKDNQMMLQQGIIDPTYPKSASPTILAPKNDVSLSFFVHSRRLNVVVVMYSYLLLIMDEFFDSL